MNSKQNMSRQMASLTCRYWEEGDSKTDRGWRPRTPFLAPGERGQEFPLTPSPLKLSVSSVDSTLRIYETETDPRPPDHLPLKALRKRRLLVWTQGPSEGTHGGFPHRRRGIRLGRRVWGLETSYGRRHSGPSCRTVLPLRVQPPEI